MTEPDSSELRQIKATAYRWRGVRYPVHDWFNLSHVEQLEREFLGGYEWAEKNTIWRDSLAISARENAVMLRDEGGNAYDK